MRSQTNLASRVLGGKVVYKQSTETSSSRGNTNPGPKSWLAPFSTARCHKFLTLTFHCKRAANQFDHSMAKQESFTHPSLVEFCKLHSSRSVRRFTCYNQHFELLLQTSELLCNSPLFFSGSKRHASLASNTAPPKVVLLTGLKQSNNLCNRPRQ